MAPILKGYLTRALAPRVAALLREGAVAVLPTDTIYGFHCAASRADAVSRIRRLKGRSGGGFILLVSDAAMADHIVARWPGESRQVLSRLWPAPLTAILPARRGFSRRLAPRGAVAVRIPAHEALRAVIAELGEPIVSTSANPSGERHGSRIGDIERAFPELDAYLSRRGRSSAAPSTIVDFRGERAAIVRRGRIPWPGGEGIGGWRRSEGQSGNPSKMRSL